jgi:hypothetical protein
MNYAQPRDILWERKKKVNRSRFSVLQCKTFKAESVLPVPKSNTSSMYFIMLWRPEAKRVYVHDGILYDRNLGHTRQCVVPAADCLDYITTGVSWAL